MHTYSYRLNSLAETTGIPLDTIKTWRQVKNRKSHCILLELAHLRLHRDVGAQHALTKHHTIREYSELLGFDNPFQTGAPIPPTTLRQWEKDGDHNRVKVFLLGFQTQLIKDMLDGNEDDIFVLDEKLSNKGMTRSQVVRLIRADASATKTLIALLMQE